jgi:LmbE family N-acetylglucosaminyl deacetylase
MKSKILPRFAQSRRALIVAPHPDDETLGCGGLVATLSRLGAAFRFIFVTDGAASHPGSRLWPRWRLAAQRRREAHEALRRLGADNAPRVFLGLPDAAMPAARSPRWKEAVTQIRDIVREFQPDLAVLPWRRDPHCDHRDSWKMAHAALRWSAARPVILEYAIWLDELGAPEDYPRAAEAEPVALDITPVVAAKRAAVAAHITQTTALIDDDPDGFRLNGATIMRLTSRTETFWRARHASD